MRRLLGTFLIAACAAAAAACSGETEETVPGVATPSVTLSRSEAAAGSPMDMTYRFVVAPDAPTFAEDYTVFVHFMDVDGERMWTDDHEPPTPTRQWKPGQTIEYVRTMFVPKFPYTGVANVEAGLYSPKSGARVPLVGTSDGQRSYQVASFTLSPQAEGVFVIFKDGWHETEVADDGSVEWQWSKKEGTIAFRNPQRDAQLFLQVDQASAALPAPQHVEVRAGTTVVDAFSLPVGVRELRRVTLPRDALGTGDTAEVTIAVDRTFVPAEVPSLRSGDSRELGIRVFRAYVEPK